MVIRAVLHETGNQKSKAAELLGINRTTSHNKLKELGLGSNEGEGGRFPTVLFRSCTDPNCSCREKPAPEGTRC
jgi:hypothetical protein